MCIKNRIKLHELNNLGHKGLNKITTDRIQIVRSQGFMRLLNARLKERRDVTQKAIRVFQI